MVGHTHVIIDQVFGVVTKGIRGQEILLPERLMSHIDAAVAKCPQYQAQPVEWLHSLWDFWGWSKQMGLIKNAAEGAFKRPELTDEQGKYQGMSDFIFTWNREHLALCQYREYHEYPLRPEGSPGIPIIQKLPEHPPGYVKIDRFQKWGMIGTKTIQNTVATYLSISTRDHTFTQEKYVTDTWNQIIREIPEIPELLKEEYKIKFEHFAWNPQIPRLTCNGNGTEQEEATTPATDEDAEYLAWRSSFLLATRDSPFAFDPVVSKEQSASAYKKTRAASEAALLGGTGPTTSRLSLVLGGKHLFAKPPNESVSLFKIEDIGKLQTPRSENPQLTCSRYEHTPATGVSGFFGTFKVARGSSKIILRRDDVLVYNVELTTKHKIVTLESLRALALQAPLEYPIPTRVPESHLEQGDNDSSDDVEDEFNFSMGSAGSSGAAARQKKQKTKAAQEKNKKPDSRSGAARRASGTSKKRSKQPKDSDSSSSEVSSESDDSGETEDESSASPPESENSSEGPDKDHATPEEEVVPALGAPADFCPEAGSLTFVLVDDNKRTHPIDLAYVESIKEKSVLVRWFGSINLTPAKLVAGKNITFQKYWNEKNKKTLETKLGIRNERGAIVKPKHDPTPAQVAQYWVSQTFSVSDGVFVPVHVTSKDALTNVWKCDNTVTLTGAFLKDTLKSALEQLSTA